MSVREEDRQKTGCPGRGLGIAAAAIGVGVGAALYYFFSKRPENPDSEGSTSSEWTCERPQVFPFNDHTEDSDSYTTVSEHTTTDTSMHDNTYELQRIWSIDSNNSINSNDYTSENDSTVSEHNSTVSEMNSAMSEYSTVSENDSTVSRNDSTISINDSNNSTNSTNESSATEASTDFEYSSSDNRTMSEEEEEEEENLVENEFARNDYNERMDSLFETIETTMRNLQQNETGYSSYQNVDINVNGSDSETAMEWDVTNSSLDVPRENMSSPIRSIINSLRSMVSPRRKKENDPQAMLREQAFRERSWSLEECSICFDVMLKDQELMTLPCTHNFHSACIMPWLQEKQTCPNCRKVAE